MTPLSVTIYLFHLSQPWLTTLKDFEIFILYGCGNGLEFKNTLQQGNQNFFAFSIL